LVRGAVIATALLGLGAGGVGLSFTPLFEAEQVLVRGNLQLRPWQVRRLSGLTVGTNVLHVDIRAAMAKLESNGWIAEASARRELPSTIVIEVRERVPVATTILEGRRAVVMGDGSVIEDITLSKLPRIWVRGGSLSERSLVPAAAALRALSDEVRAEVSAASVRPDGSLVLQLEGGVGVVYGPPVEFVEKARVLAELLRWADVGGLRIATLDVTVPQAPTARTFNGAALAP
jgi:cell division protein FtsQ